MAKKPVTGLSAGMLQTDVTLESRPMALESAVAAEALTPARAEKPVTATVKLVQPLYQRLRAYCAAHRTPGQIVTVEALDAFLKSHGY